MQGHCKSHTIDPWNVSEHYIKSEGCFMLKDDHPVQHGFARDE